MTVDSGADLRSLGEAGYADDRWRPVATGTFANRPTVALFRPNAFYYATDTGVLYYSNGVSWVGAAAASPTIATTLPGSPTDGQQVILVDSLTASTWSWLLRYNAGSTNTDKWEFLGGVALYSKVDTVEGGAAGATVWTDTATPGPSVTVPRAGFYLVRFGIIGSGNPAASSSYAGVRQDATDPATVLTEDTIIINWNANSPAVSEFTSVRMAASAVFKMRFRDEDVGRRNFWAKRWISVLPVRVS